MAELVQQTPWPVRVVMFYMATWKDAPPSDCFAGQTFFCLEIQQAARRRHARSTPMISSSRGIRLASVGHIRQKGRTVPCKLTAPIGEPSSRVCELHSKVLLAELKMLGLLTFVQCGQVVAPLLAHRQVPPNRNNETNEEKETDSGDDKNPVRKVVSNPVCLPINWSGPRSDDVVHPPDTTTTKREHLRETPQRQAQIEIVGAKGSKEERQ